jgi:hypothetical protein
MRPRHGRGAAPAGMTAQLFVTPTVDQTAGSSPWAGQVSIRISSVKSRGLYHLSYRPRGFLTVSDLKAAWTRNRRKETSSCAARHLRIRRLEVIRRNGRRGDLLRQGSRRKPREQGGARAQVRDRHVHTADGACGQTADAWFEDRLSLVRRDTRSVVLDGLRGCLGSGPSYWFGNGRVLTWPAWSTLTSINSLPRRRTAESALWLSSAQP